MRQDRVMLDDAKFFCPPHHIILLLVSNSLSQLGTFGRAKRKVDEMQKVIAEARRTGAH